LLLVACRLISPEALAAAIFHVVTITKKSLKVKDFQGHLKANSINFQGHILLSRTLQVLKN